VPQHRPYMRGISPQLNIPFHTEPPHHHTKLRLFDAYS
jgi:hypothetical protein